MVQHTKFFSPQIYVKAWIYFDLLFFITGCCIGISLNEAHAIRTNYGEALSFWSKLWFHPTILYKNRRRFCHPSLSPGIHDKVEPSWTGFPVERFRSFTFFLKAPGPAQAFVRNIKDSSKAKASSIGALISGITKKA